jgi:hypothetical protein
MKKTTHLFTTRLRASLAAPSAANGPKPAGKPNIIILIDDMGQSDIGCFDGESHTPNIDRLAS